MGLNKYEAELAVEIGINPAIVFSKLCYWLDKGYGKELDGRVYIYNTYKQWHRQFPWLTVRTIQNVFKKLIDLELVLRTKGKGWDQTSHWSVNYSHPITKKFRNGLRKNCVSTTKKVRTVINTYPNQKQTTEPTPVRKSEVFTTTKPTTNKGKYREEYPLAREWLEKENKRFRAAVSDYVDYHTNSPKVHYPQAFRMKLLVEIWRKYTKQEHHTDFEYVDKEKIKTIVTPVISVCSREIEYDEAIDAEMMNLIAEGVVPCQIN